MGFIYWFNYKSDCVVDMKITLDELRRLEVSHSYFSYRSKQAVEKLNEYEIDGLTESEILEFKQACNNLLNATKIINKILRINND